MGRHLKPEQIEQIRAIAKVRRIASFSGKRRYPYEYIAALFGVSQMTVFNTVKFKAHKVSNGSDHQS
jgi:hypothetical protein